MPKSTFRFALSPELSPKVSMRKRGATERIWSSSDVAFSMETLGRLRTYS